MASPLFILHRIFCYFLKWKAEIHALFLQVPLLAQFKVIDARCTHRRSYEEELVVVKVAQSRPTLRDPMAYTVRGSLQARTLKWVAFPFSRGIFATQGSNPGLAHCRQILYQLSHKGSLTLSLVKTEKQLVLCSVKPTEEKF